MASILGISAFYHDSAACLLKDGKILAAAQEERFSRKKHDSRYPHHAVEFVLKYSNMKLSEIDQIVFFEKPFLKFERLLETYVAFAPKGFISFAKAMPIWIKEKLFQKNLIGLKKPVQKVKWKINFNMSFIKEFWEFLKVRKKYWLLPIIIVLVLFGGLIVLTQGSAVAPFIYTIF